MVLHQWYRPDARLNERILIGTWNTITADRPSQTFMYSNFPGNIWRPIHSILLLIQLSITHVVDIANWTDCAYPSGAPDIISLVEIRVFNLICQLQIFYFALGFWFGHGLVSLFFYCEHLKLLKLLNSSTGTKYIIDRFMGTCKPYLLQHGDDFVVNAYIQKSPAVEMIDSSEFFHIKRAEIIYVGKVRTCFIILTHFFVHGHRIVKSNMWIIYCYEIFGIWKYICETI